MKKKITFINLRKEIETLRDNVGFYWVALRVIDLSKKTNQSSDKVPSNYDQPNPEDSKSLLINHSYSDKLVKAFRYLGSPGFDFLTQLGNINTRSATFIVEYDKQPKDTDFILELESDEETHIPYQPFNVVKVFKIQDSFPLRGDDGRIEFWRCHVEERNLDFSSKGVL
jgi:hypothetical protein